MGEFKSVFKNLRLAKGMTQGELADALGITRSRLSMYELGQREPDLETLEMIAGHLRAYHRGAETERRGSHPGDTPLKKIAKK